MKWKNGIWGEKGVMVISMRSPHHHPHSSPKIIWNTILPLLSCPATINISILKWGAVHVYISCLYFFLFTNVNKGIKFNFEEETRSLNIFRLNMMLSFSKSTTYWVKQIIKYGQKNLNKNSLPIDNNKSRLINI